MRDEVFYAATKILAASVTGARGEGLHESPVLVAKSVDLAEQLVAEIEKREAAEHAARLAASEERRANPPPPVEIDKAAFAALQSAKSEAPPPAVPA
jgi:hypothetical protein